MTREEYINKMNEEEDWAPGWIAIEAEFEKLYPGIEPLHYGTDFTSRAMFGGDEFLDGFSVYESGRNYKHIVTFGMSELYADEEAFGEEWSKWGYEMTLKLKADSPDEYMWSLNMLSNIARYTFKTKRYYEPEDVVPGNGTSLHIGTESKITALIVIKDTSAETLATLNGRVDFLQFYGITESELNAIKKDYSNLKLLIKEVRKDNPEFIIDMKREKSYL